MGEVPGDLGSVEHGNVVTGGALAAGAMDDACLFRARGQSAVVDGSDDPGRAHLSDSQVNQQEQDHQGRDGQHRGDGRAEDWWRGVLDE